MLFLVGIIGLDVRQVLDLGFKLVYARLHFIELICVLLLLLQAWLNYLLLVLLLLLESSLGCQLLLELVYLCLLLLDLALQVDVLGVQLFELRELRVAHLELRGLLVHVQDALPPGDALVQLLPLVFVDLHDLVALR